MTCRASIQVTDMQAVLTLLLLCGVGVGVGWEGGGGDDLERVVPCPRHCEKMLRVCGLQVL